MITITPTILLNSESLRTVLVQLHDLRARGRSYKYDSPLAGLYEQVKAPYAQAVRPGTG